MDLELLRTFLEVNRHRNFSKAGEVLHVTQSAISARIRLLESQLGVKLFARHYHDLQLTPEGSRLIRHADLLLSGWRKARQEVALGGAGQQLTVGGSLRLWDVALQDWFLTLRRQLPELAIIAELHTPELLTQRLLDGHLDVAFMLEPAQLETLQVQAVASIELVMVSARKDCPLEAALADNYLMVDWGLAHSLQHRRLYPDAPEPRLRVAQARMALVHLLELGGAAYLPSRMIIKEVHEGQLHLVAGAATIERSAYAVYPVRSSKLELLQQVLEKFQYSVALE
ncbi:MAG: LysR family transcriptional regulator [Gammaproteobacteria bacterium]|nr:LysR family transcriptional regulator [Gammaproteobacteria bacterium]